MKKILCGLVLLAGVGLATPMPCGSYTNVLTSPGAVGCTAGGLNFLNFGVNSIPTGMTVGLAVTTSASEVQLDFQIAGFSATQGQPAPDLRIIYEVQGLTTGVDNHFAGSPGTSIIETVCDSSGVTPSGGSCNGKVIGQLFDNSTLSPVSLAFATSQTDIWIIKDITAAAGFTGGVSVSDLTNSHETGTVPEPATLSMMGLGLLGLGLIGRRKRKV